jgi:glycosyltransferase involved in cell wall biosynthesis
MHISSCLESLLRQQPVPGDFEVIVVDGMSEDGTRETLAGLAKSHPRLKLVDNPARITPCGMKAGIHAASGEWIAIMGAHNRYAPDYLANCLEVARRTGADNVGGSMICEGKSLRQRAIAAAHHSPFAVGGSRWHDPTYEGPADTVFGGFYRRDVFERIGSFDESLVRNQDDELNLRLARAGGLIWHSPKIRSWYSPRSSLGALFRQYYQYGYWKVRVIQKHKLPASWRHLVPGAFVFILLLLFLLSALGFLFSIFIQGFQPSISYFSSQLSAFQHFPTVLCSLSSVLLAAVLGVYGAAVAFASLVSASRSGWRLLPVLPLVFPCYHLGYGCGFLCGLWGFVSRTKGTSISQVLTR